MDLKKYVGKRVRLKSDAPVGQKLASYLTEEQLAEGPEGVVIRAMAESDGLILEINLENVPGDRRFSAESCIMI